ncbi:MAG: tRNA (guanosine(37)-N1)-methyltransferase TrmD [Deltaproteobacteria bacterium]|jgi:tRNA (guanine37-N1)-methyltransferase|nr:tRNA (guanosine(37)-N1)-methyltransferase TrmD [Deltaproteobacteria bacterium]
MKISLLTLFPEFFDSPLSCGLMQRACASGLVEITRHNPRAYADDKRQSVDDRPYGGGPGMIMSPGPMEKALHSLIRRSSSPPRLLCLSPRGRRLDQELIRELALEKELILICGRYEGIDARLNDLFRMEELSLGDFVLNGGESAALALCEAVCRLLPGFMGHDESGQEESFSSGLLEYPQYTRPENYAGLRVPDVLLSGDHAGIARWRRQESLLATLERRPDLLDSVPLSGEDLELLRSRPRKLPGPNLYLALLHYPVLDKEQKSVCSSLTNLDVHDLARSSRAYGLGGFFAITPLEDQRLILQELLRHWISGPGGASNPDRREALTRVIPARDLEEAVSLVRERHGSPPLIWGSSARMTNPATSPTISFDEARKILYRHPVILLLGTGHGLAPEITDHCEAMLPPLRRIAPYNHLSVRCAGTVLLDRLLGEWG